MNKLHKTTYPSRQPNYNNFMGTSSGSRQMGKVAQIKSSTIQKKQPKQYTLMINKNEQKNMLRQIQKKIQIQSTLLINIKKNTRNSTRPQVPRASINKTQSKLYDSSFNRQRPQSKQQPRMKINLDNQSKIKMQFPQRPQTSKGIRPYKYVEDARKRKMSFQNNQDIIAYKDDIRAMISSSQSRRPSKVTKYNFDTSIDPQFLNLFAAH